jgi:hypothetical protein
MQLCPKARQALTIGAFILLTWMVSQAQTPADHPNYSGMYTFLREGEFVQLTVQDNAQVIGFVSRYKNAESDSFLDHFFKSGKLEGDHLSFTTETVDGVSYEFKGAIDRGEGKTRNDEGYYVLKGTLMETTTDAAKKSSSRSIEVALKSFPQDVVPPQPEKK